MIQVYSWATPNGHKVHVMLEECGLAYRAIPVNIGAGDQFKPEFLKISPNNKIPAIVDPDGPDGEPISVFESGAILLYLAAKTGRFLPADLRGKYRMLEWLMLQMGSGGPIADGHAGGRAQSERRRGARADQGRLAFQPPGNIFARLLLQFRQPHRMFGCVGHRGLDGRRHDGGGQRRIGFVIRDLQADGNEAEHIAHIRARTEEARLFHPTCA